MQPQRRQAESTFSKHPAHSPSSVAAPEFRWSDKRIWLSGVVQNKAQAQEVIDFVTAMMGFLPDSGKYRRDQERPLNEESENERH